MFLDGQAFAQPALRDDDRTPRIALVFPTGHEAAASDFESWFLFGVPTVTPLQIATVRFLNANNANSSAGDVKPPLAANQNVTFRAGEGIRSVEVTFNRAVTPASVTAASVFVERLSAAGAPIRLPGGVSLTSPTVARLTLQAPIDNGNHVLTCLGVAIAGGPGAIVASDDQSALDGNYDNQSGADFKLPFAAQ
jgi:hypothetical protein